MAMAFGACSEPEEELNDLPVFEEPTLTPEETGNTVFWSISGHDLPATSYLYGTIHLISDSNFHLGQQVCTALEASNRLVLEANFSLFSLLQASNDLAMQGETLQTLLTPEDYDLVKGLLIDSLGVSEMEFALYERLKPALLPQLLASGELTEYRSFELEFIQLANEHDLRKSGLETFEYQLQLFDEYPYEKQASELLKLVQGSGTGSDPNDLEMVYRSNDLQRLHELINAEYRDNPEFMELLLHGRNANWIPKIEEFIHTEPCFIAVGAAHLAGEAGVINLLREAGYTLTPLKLD